MSMGLGMKSPKASSANAVAMAPSTLDLFILTFNCAKTLINPPVFAAHLHGALSQNATGLPDLVVFSLQEVAPLSYAFIGSYFLSHYYARFGEALNLASAKVLASADGNDDGDASRSTDEAAAAGSRGRTPPPPPYTLVRAKNVGMTAILLYARDPASIRKIEEAECGFGAADMGNKGAVGLRVMWSTSGDQADGGGKTTELTFVATHLAAMEWNLKKRNANWRSIVAGLTFANPRTILPAGVFPANQAAAPTPDRSGAGDVAPRLPTGDSPDPSEEEPEADDAEEEDTHPLLPNTNDESSPLLSPATLAALHSISIYKPTSHLFIAGDLNYRISATTPPPQSPFPSFDPASPNFYPAFLPRDQLTRERLANRTLHGLSEAEITFGPTYKFDVLPPDGADDAENERAVREGGRVNGVAEVPWRFAPHRWPGWCDRVLYLDVPRWVSGKGKSKRKVEVGAYDALPVVESSDHRAVFFRARVPVLGEGEMMPPAEGEDEEEAEVVGEGGLVDPRVRMPVPVDVHAWERRAVARRKEMVVGWTGFVWSTREGAVLLATVLALGVGSWWLLRVW
ncbi:Endonuclease/exonuclease/phosphatase [Parachaetomium inaequale]|uniref:Endonuclease/exonuclease/phosphatase n=1 Tax=Parachaetomium inaequale TaxID=2588326 RepID=A0AAN6SSQ7_9PEZI|nr:Endonuclease/exonuclease/phosphatase [Parachaetomium inaequale]